MVKVFIGNLSESTTREEVEDLFTKYGTVTECAKFKNYAFVHMEDRKIANKAIKELNLFRLNGRPMNVEPSCGKSQGPVKIHVANVERGFEKELSALFEEYGTVSECAIVKDFAFVHMHNSEEAMDAIKGLDNSEFQGKRIHVQLSKSRPRRGQQEDEGYPPPHRNWDPYPPRHPGERPFRGRMPGGYPPPPPPQAPPRRPERDYGSRDSYNVVDYYEKYRARPYEGMGYDDRRPGAVPPPPPPPPSMLVRERLGMGGANPYERRALPPPPSYMVRDRSPIRRAPLPPAPSAGNGYSYERSRLSPLSRGAPMYAAPRPRDPYGERAPPPPMPPPPPRYAGY